MSVGLGVAMHSEATRLDRSDQRLRLFTEPAPSWRIDAARLPPGCADVFMPE